MRIGNSNRQVIAVPRVFRSKLLLPSAAGYLPRPRLLDGTPRAGLLVLQAPAGSGKTVFLAQWLQAAGLPYVYYRLDEQDRDAGAFAAHVCAGFRQIWPDWAPPAGVGEEPHELAAELAGEAATRPPAVFALDGLEAAFGQPWLADFLAVLLRYAPPGLSLALATRAPLPADPGPGARTLYAADLAFTRQEAEALLGAGDWHTCHEATGGYPLALALWREQGANWRAALTARSLAGAPPHVPSEIARGLVAQWLDGGLGLEAYAHRMSVGEPGAEQLWTEVSEIHWLHADHPPDALKRAEALWEAARQSGDRKLVGAAALLAGEASLGLGEYAQAAGWYHQAFDADPLLEPAGEHSMLLLLRDQGRLDEAEALGQRCLPARTARGDLVALAMAHFQYGSICVERGRFDEAEAHYLEAEALHQKFAANAAVGLSATCYRALLEATRGNARGFRRLAEEAYAGARGKWRYLEALTGYVLAGALIMWGERAAAERLLADAYAYLSGIGSKWHLHVLLTIFARKAWAEGRPDEAQRHFDQALALAEREGYIQYLQAPRAGALPLIADALAREVQVPLCQELLVRMGDRALPALLEMTGSDQAAVRRAALYPLATLGGEEAAAAVRKLLQDPDQTVRDSALLAYHSLVQAPAADHGPPATVTTLPEAPAGAVRLSVAALGLLAVTADGRPLPKWRTAKARDLFAYFLLQGDRPVARDQVVEALWPEGDPESTRSLLHTTLYNLRGSLGAPGEGLIKFAGGVYRMNRAGLELDLDRFQRLAASADEASWRAAAELYRGDLLEGLDYPWCEAPRTHLRRLYLSVLHQLAAKLQSDGRQAEAIEFLQLIIQVDPLDEEGHRALMEAYAARGNRSSALQQYRTLARLLDDELGLEPGARVQALYKQLLD